MSTIRTWEVPDLLEAKGDQDQLVALVSVMVDESDAVWAPIAEHIREHKLHKVYERHIKTPETSWFGGLYARWYCRRDVFTHVAATGLTDRVDARVDSMLEAVQ